MGNRRNVTAAAGPAVAAVTGRDLLPAWHERGPRRALLRDLIAAQGGRCQWCGWKLKVGGRARRRSDGRAATFDHLTPLDRGGTDARDNLCAACAYCNHQRGNATVAEWLEATGGGLFPEGGNGRG